MSSLTLHARSSFRLSPLASLLAAAALASPVLAADPVTPPVFSNPLASTNPYAPFVVGAMKVHTGRDQGARITVIEHFRADTRVFLVDGEPVECHTLAEIEFEDGELVEISLNWFAEADDGTVYYFGEVVDDYEDGAVSGHGGSWLVGGPTLPADPEDTATAEVPAVFMPGEPEVGDSWKPEDLFPLVDETVTLLDDEARLRTPAGSFEDALKVQETSDLPDSSPELKWYAAGLGVVRAKGRGEKLDLVASTLSPVGDGE